jgi:hypothetical protein
MRVICAHCGRDIPARDCPCREGSSNLARVTMVAAALAGERGKKIGADEMRIASSVLRSEVEA